MKKRTYEDAVRDQKRKKEGTTEPPKARMDVYVLVCYECDQYQYVQRDFTYKDTLRLCVNPGCRKPLDWIGACQIELTWPKPSDTPKVFQD